MSGPVCPASHQDEFFAQLARTVIAEHVPFGGAFDLTEACNLSCLHCYATKGQRELPTALALRTIDEIAKQGCLCLLFSGGEPILHSEFERIYTHAKEAGLLLTVFTNGTTVSERIADLFKDLPPRSIEISVHGASQDIFEQMTAVDGSYLAFRKGLDLLASRGIQFHLKTILTVSNQHEIEDIRRLAKDMEAGFRLDPSIFPRINGDLSPIQLRLPPAEAVDMEFRDPDLGDKWLESLGMLTRGDPARLYTCNAGIASFHVDVEGRLLPCVMMPWISHDLHPEGFAVAWDSVAEQMARKVPPEEFICTDCEMKNLCGYCPAFQRLETGSETQRSDYLCLIGHERLKKINELRAMNGLGPANIISPIIG